MTGMLASVLKAYVNNERVADFDTALTDWESLYEVCNENQISGVVFYMLKDQISLGDENQRFQSAYYSSIHSYMSRVKQIKVVEERFCKQKLPYALMKGACLAEKHPIPALRTMGDIDIVVPELYFIKADKELIEIGYDLVSAKENHERVYSRKGIKLELHNKLLYTDRGLSQNAIKFFNAYELYIQENGRLDRNFHFLFLFAHLLKHLAGHGAGIRQFMDIAILTREDDLDWRWITNKAKEVDLLTFVQNVLSLNSLWFGVAAPIECPQLNEEFTERVTNEVFNNGVFGFGDDESHKKVVAKQIMNNGKQYRSIRAMTIIDSIFPDRESLLQKEAYQYLKKHPYLLPIAWVQRFFSSAFSMNKMRKFCERVFIPQKDINKQLDRMKEWGMYLK